MSDSKTGGPKVATSDLRAATSCEQGAFNDQGKTIYRLLTGIDDKNFCLKVSEALAQGYELHGSPSITFNGSNVVVAQAVIWKK